MSDALMPAGMIDWVLNPGKDYEDEYVVCKDGVMTGKPFRDVFMNADGSPWPYGAAVKERARTSEVKP